MEIINRTRSNIIIIVVVIIVIFTIINIAIK